MLRLSRRLGFRETWNAADAGIVRVSRSLR